MKRVTKRPRGRPPHADLLTPAEWRTVHAVQHGMTNAEIARRRGVSVNAVKFHMANALAKLNLRNRRELRLQQEACGLGIGDGHRRRNDWRRGRRVLCGGWGASATAATAGGQCQRRQRNGDAGAGRLIRLAAFGLAVVFELSHETLSLLGVPP